MAAEEEEDSANAVAEEVIRGEPREEPQEELPEVAGQLRHSDKARGSRCCEQRQSPLICEVR